MSLMITLAAFAVAIGVLVSFHEYGHYWVAKRCGVKVLTFSIGFGQPLLKWKIGETQWQLAAIPLGGYVKMLDEREDHVAPADLSRAFNRLPPLQRMAVVVAGPLANFLFAIVVYWGIYLHGVEITQPRIGTVVPHSLAADAGFAAGDTITAINGDAVDTWVEARMALIDQAAAAATVTVTITTLDGSRIERKLDFTNVTSDAINGDITSYLGLSLAVYKPVLGQIQSASVAQKAGLQAGDKLLAVAGMATPDWLSFAHEIQSRPNLVTPVSLVRDGRQIEIMLIPAQVVDEHGKAIGRIGVGPVLDMAAMQSLQRRMAYGPWQAFRHAMDQTWQSSALSIRMMWRMVTGHVSYKQLSGPVAIAGFAGQSAQAGLGAYLEFLCLISISLGVLNLLPLPVLDGGHLMYYSAELLRGRPVSERVMELGQRVGVGLLAALMIVALFNDISRLVGS